MQLAHRIGLGLSLTHGFLFFVAFRGANGFMLDIFLASIYLPLAPFAYMGLPVTDDFDGWGWSGPSFLGYLIIILVWLGAWFVVGRIIQFILKR